MEWRWRAARGRALVPIGVALAIGVTSPPPVASAHDGGPHSQGGSFSSPPSSERPKFRYWWPAGTVSRAEVAREINQIADAGFGGVEIADVYDSVTQKIDPAQYGWASRAWNAAVETALRTAKSRGLEVDLTIGPHWPSSVPGLQPDDQGAEKELTYGNSQVAGGATFAGALPAPANAPAGATRFNPNPPVTPHVVTVQAARCATDCSGSPIVLDRSSLVDLTSKVHNGTLTWTAPAGGQWQLVVSYERGTGQLQRVFDFAAPGSLDDFTDPRGYVVDHYGKAGAQAVIDYWNGHLLTPTIRSLLRDVHGAIFEDSLELNRRQDWTPTMLSDFRNRRGYSLVPFLPVVQGLSAPVFSYDADTTARVRHDFEQTLSDLYLANRVRPLKQWANSYGLKFRNQPYGAPIDGPQEAAQTDIPEGESLAFGDNLDKFRALATGRDIGGKRLLSDEAGAFAGGAYDVTWQQLLATINSNYAAGVNQAVIHGFAYADAPTAIWPGFHPFFPLSFFPGGFGEPWGPRQPTWGSVTDLSGYLGRTQHVLQTGTDRVDVAIYNGALDVGGGSQLGGSDNYFNDLGLARAGYSYGFLTPGVLTEPAAFVAGRRLAPLGPGYRGFVIDQQPAMPLATARKILGYARAGLPVVIVGAAPSTTPGYDNDQAALRATMAQLTALPRVKTVAAESDVPAALASLGVTPAAANTTPADVLNVHRSAGGVDYYYLYNHSSAPVAVNVALAGRGLPYRMDAWTGAITPVSIYHASRDGVTVPVQLAPNDTTIIALAGSRPSWSDDHVESTTADQARVSDHEVILRDGTPGTYTATLNNGRTATARIAAVPPTQTLSRWHLSAEDWRPGAAATTTNKVDHELDLNGLKPWTDIPELQDASGIGRYSTTVTLGSDWRPGTGAYLDLGQVYDQFRVTVNGRPLPPLDQLQTTVDLGDRLHRGTNSILVEEATTLSNRIRATTPALVAGRPARPYGLVGPVTLRPYSEVAARTGH